MAILSEAELIRELRARVVRADRAYVCCKSNVARTFGDITALLTAILSAIDSYSAGKRVMLALAPGVSPLTKRLVLITEGELAVGLIVVLGITEISRLAATKAVYDLLGDIGTAIGTLLGQKGDSCEECVRAQLLSQDNPRVTEDTRHRHRIEQ